MKVCYLIQTHKNPAQIERLVRTLKRFSPNAQIVINHDFTNCPLDKNFLQDLSDVQVLPSRGGRGNFAIVQSYLDVVDWLMSQNCQFDWLINLSGQDYPIQSPIDIENFLSKTNYDGFLLYFEVFSPESHWTLHEGKTRYHYKYQTLIPHLPEWQKKLCKPLKAINYIQPFYRVNFAYGLTLGLKTPVPFNETFKCYGGSYLCTLSYKCVDYLYRFIQTNPDLIDYYQGVAIPDESFIHTILLNNPDLNLCNDCKRYFDFSQTHNGHPKILSSDDFSALSQSSAHFARKFDPTVDEHILDRIDQKLLQQNLVDVLQ